MWRVRYWIGLYFKAMMRNARTRHVVPHIHHWTRHGLRTIGDGHTHRTPNGRGGYNGRTGNPPTGNRRPGMRRTRGGEI